MVGVIALLLFGKRLPEVARNLGKGFSEFKKGMQGMQDEVRTAASSSERLDYGSSDSTTPERPTSDSAEDSNDFDAPAFELEESKPS